MRWCVRARPAAAIAFDRTVFEEMIAEAGLECVNACFGFYPGEATRIFAQDVLLLRRACRSRSELHEVAKTPAGWGRRSRRGA